ncbi:ALDH-like protein, partial [Violaceomyces palustris]
MTDFASQSPIPCIVNNEPLKTTKTYPVYKVGTSNQEVLHQVSCVDRHQAIQAVQACQDAFPVWRSTPVVERRRIFLKAQRLFQERISDHVQKLVQETVLTPGASAFDVAVLVDQHITEAASVMSTALKGEILPDGEDGVNKYVFREPFGVVLAI